MIRIQAFRDGAEAERPDAPYRDDQDSRNPERDREKKEKKPLAPLAVLLALSGLLLYLKSFWQGRSEAAPQDEAQAPQPEAPALPAPEGGDPARAAATDPEEEEEPDNVVPFSSSGLYTPAAIGDFMASGEPPISFGPLTRPPLPPQDGRLGPAPTIGFVLPINDNQSPRSLDLPRGGGGGGGGSDPAAPGEAEGEDEDDSEPSGTDTPGAGNRAPRVSGPLRLPDLIGCQAYFIPIALLLEGAADPDGDPLVLSGLTASAGRLTPVEGGFLFDAPAGWLGEITLGYAIGDGGATVAQSASFAVVPVPPILGTAAADTLLGSDCADAIHGRDGDDNIDARGGDDLIEGGAGDDHIRAGAGDDVVFAGDGNDVVFAGEGNDIVFGGAGHDRLFGEAGDDILFGEDGDDLLDGGAGDDTLSGGAGDDVLLGGSGDDLIFGDEGHDRIEGGDGNDTIADGAGADSVLAGDGDDHVIAATHSPDDDRYDGGAGIDTLDYSSARLDLVIDLKSGKAGGLAKGLEIGLDLISGFEAVIAGAGNDHVIAGAGPFTFTGGKGRDTFEFRRSDDDDERPGLVWTITDFTIGDRLIIASYEIHQIGGDDDIQDGIRDLFEDIYLTSAGDDDRRPVRFRFEKHDDRESTFVEIRDDDHPGSVYSVELPGRHQLEFTVSVS